MPWPLRIVQLPPHGDLDLEPGDCYFAPPEMIKTGKDGGRYVWGHRLSDEYERERASTRQPLFVMLPSGGAFCVDSAVTGETRGWQVSGEPPKISVQPSINCVGIYHGWITDGVLSDDCEGRQYERVPHADGTGFWWRRKAAS